MYKPRIIIASLIAIIMASVLHAQDPSEQNHPMLNQYLQHAAENSPALKASFQEYLASLEQVPQVKALPDPQVAFGYFVQPIETRVGPQSARFSLSQMFPWFGTLSVKEERAALQAKAAFEEFQNERNALFNRVHTQWYKLYELQETIRIMEENIQILESFEELALRRYETGKGRQVDVLRVQIEKEELINRLQSVEDNRDVAEQRFREIANLQDEVIQPADTLTRESLDVSEDDLHQQMVSGNPSLKRLDLHQEARSMSIRLAELKDRPSFGVGVDYILTGERDIQMSDNGKDALMAKATLTIPLSRSKYNAQKKEARLQLESVQHKRTARLLTLETDLQEALRSYDDAQRRIELYNQKQIQRTQQAMDILITEYSADGSDFEEILRMQRQLLNYRLSLQQAIVDQQTALSTIRAITGAYRAEESK